MTLAGTQLKARDVAALAHTAGWRDRNLVIAVAVAHAESDFYTEAENDQNPDGTIDRGVWQVNSTHLGQVLAGGPVTIPRLFNAADNARIAHAIWKTSGWEAWAAYTTGRYHENIPGALNAIRYMWLLEYDFPLP